jgi:hypothetical protein
MKKVLLIAAIMFSLAGTTKGQGNEFIFNWQIAIPGEGITGLVDKTSFQGWGFEYRYALSHQFTVGAGINWNIFHEEIEKSTWQFKDVAITSRNWRYTHTVPLSVNAHFNPLRNEGHPLQIFLGGGIGASYVNQEIWAGFYTFRHEAWSFHAYPEVGLRWVMSDQTAILFSSQFMYMPSASWTDGELTYWNFKLGFSFGRHRWD